MYSLVKELKTALLDCKTVLDVGCGTLSPLRFLSEAHLVGLDGYSPALNEARQNGTHDEYLVGDVRRVSALFPGRRFEASVALDLIEHLSKEDGWRFLEEMERVATKRVIIVTPNGFVPQRSKNGDLQEHLSGWTAEEMRGKGYEVLGLFGPKRLRGEYHAIRYRPRLFWVLLSMLGNSLFTRARPEAAAALFCLKRLS